MLKKSTAGGLDSWAWNAIRALPLPWFSGLAILFNLVETTGNWPQGLLDACIAMIPKADVDSTPLGQRTPWCPTCCLSDLGFPLAWTSLSVGSGVEAWFSNALDIEEVLSGTGRSVACCGC